MAGAAPEIGLEETLGGDVRVCRRDVESGEDRDDEVVETFDRELHCSNWSNVSPVSAKVRVT
jgi:hypothetical protein